MDEVQLAKSHDWLVSFCAHSGPHSEWRKQYLRNAISNKGSTGSHLATFSDAASGAAFSVR